MKKLSILITFCVITLSAFAQNWKITGTVTEAGTNEPLTGVTVQVKNKKIATSTDLDGAYSIEASMNDELVFTFLGMQTVSKTVSSAQPINVVLSDDNVALEQVVVIGYGTVKKSDLTGAVSSISSKDLQADVAKSAASALQGRVAGVSVTNFSGQPGAGMNIAVRGVTSLSGTPPLYIIDGVYGDINLLDPADIASIEVLKDASAAAIYGSRAASGVVLITTKGGRKDSPSKINLNVYAGIQSNPKKLDVLNGEQWARFVTDNGIHDYTFTGKGTDWQDEIYRTAAIYKANLGISGGSKTSTYNVSIGYINQEGIMLNSNYDAFNVRMKNEFSFLNNRLRIGESLILKTSKQNLLDSPGLVTQALRMPPVIPVHDDERLGGWGTVESWMTNVANPVGDIYANSSWDNNSSRLTQILFNGYAEVDILKGLRYKLNFGLNKDHGTAKAFRDYFDFGSAGMNQLPDLKETSSNTDMWLLENTLNYDNTFGKHTIYGLLGYSAQKNKNRAFSAGREELPIGTSTIGAGSASKQSADGSENVNTTISMFARVMYSYDSRYMLSASIRRDGSSRFADGYRWGNFPSFSAGWNIQNEAFAEPMRHFVDELKLRISYGKLGNQEIGNYMTQRLVTPGINYVQGKEWWMGSMPGIAWVSPKDLTWETNETANIGLDFTLFKGKLSFTLDAFTQKNKNILLGVDMPSSSGLNGKPTLNAGTFQNRGFEFTVNHRNSLDKVYYSLGANMSIISNKMKEITVGATSQFPGYNPQGLGTITWAKVGDPIGAFYLVKTAGIFQSKEEVLAHKDANGNVLQPDAEPGDIRFVDINNDGKIDEQDAQNLGNPNPDVSFGFRASVEWNNFDLGLFFDGMVGNKVFNFTRYRMESMLDKTNYGARVLDAWKPEHRNTGMPRYAEGDPNKNARIYSDRWLENGSFLRLKTLELGYTIPKNILNKWSLSTLRVYTSFENLFTITGYKGYTPDLGINGGSGTNSSSGAALTRGVDHGRYPIPRIISFGIQIGL